MLVNTGDSLSLVSLDDVNDVDISSGLMDVSWSSLVDILKNHDIRDSKEGPCFIPAQFKEPDQWTLSENDEKPTYRHDLNVDSISVVVLDLDEDGAKEQAEKIFQDFEHVIYSTHSYTKDTPYKHRIVLRLESPIPGADWPYHFKSLISSIDADRSCGNLSRVFYFPSHSPSAGISPYFSHKEGKLLSISDIEDIRKNYESGLTPDELKEFRKKSNPSDPNSSVRTHFTGKKMSIHDLKNLTIDYSYEGMKETFAKFLPELVDNDNRHDFALKVSGSAISKWGSKVDFFNLVQFMYKASTEYGSKSLIDPSGDTRKEIPEMISSAVNKYAPELVSGENPAYQNLRSLIKEIILQVERIAITGAWDFPDEKVTFSDKDEILRSLDKRLNGGVDYSRNVIRERNYDLIKEFITSGKLINFSRQVFERELSLNPNKMNINSVSQFIFYCIDGYSRKVLKDTDMRRTLAVAKDVILKNRDVIIPDSINNELNQKFFNSSLDIAEHRALKGEFKWSLSLEPDELSENVVKSKTDIDSKSEEKDFNQSHYSNGMQM